jgi:hypothetical protein
VSSNNFFTIALKYYTLGRCLIPSGGGPQGKSPLVSWTEFQKRLVQLFRYGEISQDVILDELNQLKKDRELDSGKLEAYLKTKERLTSLERAEVMLSDYCRQLHKELDKANYQDKRVVLDMLAIRVTATSEAVDIQGVIPLQPTPTQSSDNLSYLLTTGQTSA